MKYLVMGKFNPNRCDNGCCLFSFTSATGWRSSRDAPLGPADPIKKVQILIVFEICQYLTDITSLSRTRKKLVGGSVIVPASAVTPCSVRVLHES